MKLEKYLKRKKYRIEIKSMWMVSKDKTKHLKNVTEIISHITYKIRS